MKNLTENPIFFFIFMTGLCYYGDVLYPNFGDVSLSLSHRRWVSWSEDPKLILSIILRCVTQSIWPRYTNVTDKQTDVLADSSTALRIAR